MNARSLHLSPLLETDSQPIDSYLDFIMAGEGPMESI